MSPEVKNTYNVSVQCEHRVFINLIDLYPGLLDRLTMGKEEDVIHIGDLVRIQNRKFLILTMLQLSKGASGA
jgi:hypothetical protein